MAVRVDTTRRNTKKQENVSSGCSKGRHGNCAALSCKCPCHYQEFAEEQEQA